MAYVLPRPAARRPVSGLVEVLGARERDDLHWAAGPGVSEPLRWTNPYNYGSFFGQVVGVCDVTTTGDPLSDPGFETHQAQAVVTRVSCTTMDERLIADARDAFEVLWPRTALVEVETGAVRSASGTPGHWLAEGGVYVLEGGAVQDPRDALAGLERIGQGIDPVIWASRQTVLQWAADRLVSLDGEVMRTALGTPIVMGIEGFGPGGTPPADGAVWAHVTPRPTLLVGPTEANFQVDRSVDDAVVLFSKIFCVLLDPPERLRAAVKIDHSYVT